jgi:hypothetical protein
MRILSRRIFLLGAASTALCSSAHAGPYFNTYQTDVDELSRDAVRKLNDARSAVLDMFNDLDAGKLDAAETDRKRVLTALASAEDEFRQVADKVGTRPLALSPKTDDEKLVLEQFRQALERRKLAFPQTEYDLAQVAVIVVGEYSQTIAKADLKGFPKNWKPTRDIILSEINLLSVGNLASIIWVISKGSS